MENQTTKPTETRNGQKDEFAYDIQKGAQEPVDLTHDKLLTCLYFLWDAFQHGIMDMFLIRNTARDAISDLLLHGDKITVGCRRNEWESNWGLLKIFFENERIAYKLSDKVGLLTGEFQEIPFEIHLYTDNICLEALNPIVYQHESFYVPNMFERFESEYDKKEV